MVECSLMEAQMNILFICTGNTCRSPMAEALLQNKSTRFRVKSAGIFANPQDLANPKTLTVLKEKGISFQHQSQPVTVELLQWANLVLTMTSSHKDQLLLQYEQYGEKIHTLKQYVSQFGHLNEKNGSDIDVPDPFGGSIENYRQTCEELNILVDKLLLIHTQREE